MEITAFHKNTYASYKKFFKLTLCWINIIFYVFEIFIAICILACITSLISGGKDITSLILFSALELIWILYHSFLPLYSYKKTKVSNNSVDNYVFYEDKIQIKSQSNGVYSESSINYEIIKKVYETYDMFYIYISQHQAYIVEKNTISGGTLDDLRNLLINKTDFKKYKFKM